MTLRAVFLGSHTFGVRSLEALCEAATVELVVAHPPNPEDGVRFESVSETAQARCIPVEHWRGRDPELANRVRELAPDLIWITNYRFLVPPEVIAAAKVAAVNLHPSLLPRYRGRAVLNWAIINGETEVGLTAHLIDEGIDTGPILRQQALPVDEWEDIGGVVRRLEPIYQTMTSQVVHDLSVGEIEASPQPAGDWPVWPRRTPKDGVIDWSRPAREVVNLVRAVAEPYPGARTMIGERKLLIWTAEVVDEGRPASHSGRVGLADNSTFEVECGQGCVRVTKWEIDGAMTSLTRGMQLGSAADLPGP